MVKRVGVGGGAVTCVQNESICTRFEWGRHPAEPAGNLPGIELNRTGFRTGTYLCTTAPLGGLNPGGIGWNKFTFAIVSNRNIRTDGGTDRDM